MKKYLTYTSRELFQTLFLFAAIILTGAMKANAQINVTATAGTLGPIAYTTLHAAFDAINAGTHQGVINISITTSGTITETLADTLISSGSGSASYTSVLVKPATGITATITNSITTNGTIFLYGAGKVTIDGSNTVGGTTQDLTIKNTGAGSVIRMSTPSASVACSNDTVKNCIISGKTGTGTSTGTAAIVSDGGTTVGATGLAPTARITVQNNAISSGGRGVQANGPTATMDTNWVVTGNTITGFWTNGVQITNGFNPLVSNNTITALTGLNFSTSTEILISGGQNTTLYGNTLTGFTIPSGSTGTSSGGTAYTCAGIEATNGQTVVIDSNVITGPSILGSFTSSGGAGTWVAADIYINSGNTTTIDNNIINGPTTFKLNSAPIVGIQLSAGITGANVYNNQVSGINAPAAYGSYGIYISATTTGSDINVYNNYVTNISGSVGGTVAQIGQGIYMDQGDVVNIYENSLNQTVEQPGATTGSPVSACLCFNPIGSITNINVEDNILVDSNTLGSPCSIYSGSPSSIFTTIDYNDYNAPFGNMGNIGGTNLNTIANMQTGFGGNLHSITFQPLWMSSTDLQLVVSATNAPLNAGIFITTPSITTDIYGVTRLTPTIGADELILCTLPAITGTPTLCSGSTTALSDATGGGTWSSSNTAIATVSGAGVVYGVAAGTATISYTTTCSVTKIVTVGTLPITGATTVCTGSTTSLSDATPGGVWSSTNTAVATVSATGVVHGVSAGSANISYTFGSCSPVGVAITVATLAPVTGTLVACPGSTTTLSEATSGGVWSSINTAVATVSGAGVVYGVSAGTATISYTYGSCAVSAAVTVGTLPITGTATVCAGSTTSLSDATAGGVWSSSSTTVATISGTGIVNGVSTGSAVISYTLGSCTPATLSVSVVTLVAITGSTSVCSGSTTHLSDATAGGVWSSSSTTIATVSGTGVVTGVSAGSAVISYTLGSCSESATVTVGTLPAITGATSVCVGSTAALSDATTGGVWSSNNTTVATVSGTGVVYGVSAGTANISYTTGSCSVGITVTVATLSGITPTPASVCVGSAIILSDATAGGVWSISSTTIATVSGTTGVVTGATSGGATISYTVGSCSVTVPLTVGSTIAAITGSDTVCIGATITLNDGTTGGTWSSSNTTVATVVPGTGVVHGVATGTSTISYTVGSCSVSKIVTVIPNNAGTITGSDTVCTGTTTTLADAMGGGVWSSSNTSKATVSSTGVVTGGTTTSTVTVTISYIVTNTCGTYTATTVMHVFPAAHCPTGIEQVAGSQGAELKVFPNPNTGTFTMNLTSDNNEEVHVVITNIVGEKVSEFITATNKNTDIRLAPSAGIYLLSASTADGRYVAKVVVY